MPDLQNYPAQVALLSAVTSTTTGTATDAYDGRFEQDERTFTCVVSGTGSVSATVLVQVSNNNADFITLATITLSGTTSDTDGFVSDESWQYVRGKVTAISGTSAAVTLTLAA